MHRTRLLALKESKEAKKTGTISLCLLFVHCKDSTQFKAIYEKMGSATVVAVVVASVMLTSLACRTLEGLHDHQLFWGSRENNHLLPITVRL